MTYDEFASRLHQSTKHVMAFTRTMVLDHLPDAYLYLIAPNASYDGHARAPEEMVFPEDALPRGTRHCEPTNAVGASHALWRDGRVPEWINISVYRTDAEYTYLQLLCCGRFTANDELLYHKQEGFPPFHALSPPIPWEWSRNKHGKLDHTMTWDQQLELHGRYSLPPEEDEL
ncbi:MAG: hypothetical protein ACRYFS_13560 [Janthinobacterium lividum]